MQAFEEQKTSGVNSSLKLKNGILDFHAVFVHDTIFIQGKDSLIYVPVEVPGPVTNELTWSQGLWIRLGKLLASGMGLFVVIRLVLRRFK